MKAAVLGATGYTGQLLLRLLSAHPEIGEILAVSSSRPGEKLQAVDPGLGGSILAKLEGSGGRLMTVAEAEKGKPEVVFSCLPHLESARVCAPFFGRAVVIDLSADFRLQDPESFRRAYGEAPPRADLLPRAVYGLCEWHRERIRESDLIANPGCYPTASLLPLLPLAREGMLRGPVVINAISGISGAGRKLKTEYLFCERAENACAYSPGRTHRHAWEIEAELAAQGFREGLFFTPHLAPLRRGMAVTTWVGLKEGIGGEEIESCYKRAYGQSPFIGLRRGVPQTREVWGSNRCDIGFQPEGEHLMLFSVIDNLMKGASGQAVQNMNIRFGFDEKAGLSAHGEL